MVSRKNYNWRCSNTTLFVCAITVMTLVLIHRCVCRKNTVGPWIGSSGGFLSAKKYGKILAKDRKERISPLWSYVPGSTSWKRSSLKKNNPNLWAVNEHLLDTSLEQNKGYSTGRVMTKRLKDNADRAILKIEYDDYVSKMTRPDHALLNKAVFDNQYKHAKESKLLQSSEFSRSLYGDLRHAYYEPVLKRSRSHQVHPEISSHAAPPGDFIHSPVLTTGDVKKFFERRVGENTPPRYKMRDGVWKEDDLVKLKRTSSDATVGELARGGEILRRYKPVDAYELGGYIAKHLPGRVSEKKKKNGDVVNDDGRKIHFTKPYQDSVLRPPGPNHRMVKKPMLDSQMGSKVVDPVVYHDGNIKRLYQNRLRDKLPSNGM